MIFSAFQKHLISHFEISGDFVRKREYEKKMSYFLLFDIFFENFNISENNIIIVKAAKVQNYQGMPMVINAGQLFFPQSALCPILFLSPWHFQTCFGHVRGAQGQVTCHKTLGTCYLACCVPLGRVGPNLRAYGCKTRQMADQGENIAVVLYY